MSLTLYQLPPSPNNVKVRLALALKKIPHEVVNVDPSDRSKIIELSGQELLPILTDGDKVIYDSNAILRYLDANFRDGPRLFSKVREEQQAIEQWELFTRTQIGACIGMVFGQFFAPECSDAAIKEANDLLAERVPKIEEALASQEYLMGSAPNAADVTAAPFVGLGLMDPAQFEPGGIQAFFAEKLRLPADFPRTAAWVKRVMALDA